MYRTFDIALRTLRDAIRHRKATVNPARSVSHRREDNSRIRYLKEEEEKALRPILESKYRWHLPEFDLALNTGLRQGSQYSLTWSMVDWNARMVHVPRTKNEEPLHVSPNDAALAALRIVRSRNDADARVFLSEQTGEPLEHPRHWFEPALREAKISDFHWHDQAVARLKNPAPGPAPAQNESRRDRRQHYVN